MDKRQNYYLRSNKKSNSKARESNKYKKIAF